MFYSLCPQGREVGQAIINMPSIIVEIRNNFTSRKYTCTRNNWGNTLFRVEMLFFFFCFWKLPWLCLALPQNFLLSPTYSNSFPSIYHEPANWMTCWASLGLSASLTFVNILKAVINKGHQHPLPSASKSLQANRPSFLSSCILPCGINHASEREN